MKHGSRALVLAAALLVSRALLDPGSAPEPAASDPPPHGAMRLLYGERLDANREPPDVLALLPGIGPARARALIEARPLCSLADVDRVAGIGPVTLRTLSDRLTFSAPPHGCE
jgi:competence protein ComEA